MHEIEGQMKADEEEPEVPSAQPVGEHLAGEFGIPEVESGKDHEEDGADQHIVEMGHHEVGVAQLPVERRDGKNDAGESGDEELKEESDRKQHRRGEVDVPAP